MDSFHNVKIIFSSQNDFEQWLKRIATLGASIKYSANSYDCVYMNLEDDFTEQAIIIADSLGAVLHLE